MNKRLFVIGNGFDLFHNLHTSYRDFKNYFEENDNASYCDFCNLYDSHKDRLWSDLERTLGELNYEDDLLYKCACYLNDDYSSDDWRDSGNFDFQYEVEKYLQTLDALKSNLETWIQNIRYDFEKKFKFTKSDTFLTFNYTLTLEIVYSINKDKILHIHNKVGEDIVVGHNNELCEVLLDHHNPDHFDFRIQQSIKDFNEYMERYRKHTDEILEENIEFFEKTFKEIIVIGHSISDVDLKYFETLTRLNKEAKWIIVYYSTKDKKHYEKLCDTLLIKKYKILNYNELLKYLN